MASIYDLKPRFQAMLRPGTRRLASAGVTANQVTVAALLLSVAAGTAIALAPSSRVVLLLVAPVLLLRMALNAVDGMLAREHAMKSDLGLVLNEIGDVAADAALYLPFALVPGVSPFLVAVTVVLAVTTEMTGVVAVQIGAQRRYDGPLGKSDRAFLFGLIALLLGCGVSPGRWLDILFAAAVFLLAITIVRRARRALQAVAADAASGRCKPGGNVSVAGETSRPSTDPRTAEEHSCTTSDGTELFYRAWRPRNESPRAIVLFHRGHEHSARWQDFVDRIGLDDHWFFAWDARGHGRSPGDRGYAESFGRMVRDADEWVRHVCHEHGVIIENISVVAQSVGAVLAATWLHDYAPPVRAMVLATPALRVKLYVPFAIPGLRLLRRIKPKSFIKSYVKPKMLTHDSDAAREYAEDELISPQIAVNILLDLYDTSTRLIQDAGAITAPVLMLISGADWVVRIKPQERFFERLSSAVKESETYAGFYHSTFWEKDRDRPIARAREFIVRQCEDPAPAPTLLEADQQGYSKRACDELRRPLPAFSPKRWGFAAQSLTLKTLGRLSKGIQMGWQTGFDSGESLDHVYRNTAEGITPLGRLIDRIYLDSPGWRGIRQRKVHMLQMLEQAVGMIRQRGEPVRILDIAAGPGRYVLETIRRHSGTDISAILCDRDPGGLEAGRRLAESMGVAAVTYKQSDAFDADAIAAHAPRPNVAVVSGLYELFPENTAVRASLRGLSAAIDCGLLIYTNQPWHPQHEMIARVLPNRDGDPWIMRCRTQQEMDQLVAEAGFKKIDMLIDEEGIFSVSLAVKE